jgi:nitroimidazol reductase NimA-like FMN-containing flavoprotein (pyridoxamine 5'-phosphate oxidase superfamily)
VPPQTNRQHWAHPPENVGRDDHGLGLLGEDECLRLLAGQHVGRLGFSAGGLPVVHPVNYFLDDRTIVFRSESGQKVEAARHDSVACLEIDHFDGLDHSGWSVLATGRLSLATSAQAERLARLPVAAWAFATPDWFVELPIELLSGRAVTPGR